MIVKYSILGYFIGEGFANVFKNKKSTGASLMIMCATMIIFGVFLILGENINHFVSEVEQAQGIQVFATEEATDEQITELGEKIKTINGVNKIEYVSKEDALNQMKEKFADKVVMTTGNIRDPKVAEQILEEGRADLIGMGRGLIADPEWVNKVQSGKESPAPLW